jgi:PKD domain
MRRRMGHLGAILLVLFWAMGLPSIPGRAQPAAGTTPEVYFVPNVKAQFNAFPDRAAALGFTIGNSPDPSACKHYQGIARSTRPGRPYFFVTRSGIHTTGCPFDDDDPGNLLVVRMGSRDTNGERLRSNRFAHGIAETTDTPPDPGDEVVSFITFDGTDGWPNYGHPGGVQLVGDVLAVPLESPYGGGPDNLVLFVDVSDPLNPTKLSEFDPGERSDWSAGLVGLAPQPDGRYLMLITGKNNEYMRVYQSKATEEDGTTDLKDASLDWTFLDEWSEAADEDDLGSGADWPTSGILGAVGHQSLNFVRQGNIDGSPYLMGGRNTTSGGPLGEDWIDLYRVEWEGSQFKLRWESSRHLTALAVSTASFLGSGDIANFAAANGTYVSPSGELLFYATEHDNDGPIGDVKMGEWRHHDMVRPGSPTVNPTAVPGGPFEVAEGGTVEIEGHGEPPITKAWMELFADPDFDDRSVIIDYPDWGKDDFDDFKDLDPATDIIHAGFDDQTSSMRWFAPVGCTIRINDDDFGDSDFPGENTRTLPGTGSVERITDFDDLLNDGGDTGMDDEITSAQFFSNCDDYYAAPIQVSWDLDRNGSYETAGQTPTLSAANLDGPDDVFVPMLARHPTDGRIATGEVEIHVTNVPPSIVSIAAFDPLDQEFGTDVQEVLVGLPISLKASFTDPGKPDTHVATLDWGDGSIVPSDEFDQFVDSTGGTIGYAQDSHVFTVPGMYDLTLQVGDDDGGLDEATVTVEVIDARAAVRSVIERIDALLVGETDPDVVQALLAARAKLDGSNLGAANNGAIDDIDSGDLEAALVKMEAAVIFLEEAEAAGAGDLGSLKTLLGLAAWSMAQVAYVEAQEAVDPPTSGEARQLATIAALIEHGEDLLADGQYADAIGQFHEALRRSLALL